MTATKTNPKRKESARTLDGSAASQLQPEKTSSEQPPAYRYSEVILAACFLWIVSFAIYFATRYKGIPGGDSGELLAVACQDGVAHPPGYPLYTWLVQLFMKLPLGETPHQRAAVLSCAATSTSGSLVMMTATLLFSKQGGEQQQQHRPRVWSGLASAGMFLFSPLVWTYATQAEVFGLNTLLASALILLVVIWCRAPPPPSKPLNSKHKTAKLSDSRSSVPHQTLQFYHRVAQVAALTAGLALSNQHTITLLLLPAGLVALPARRHLITPSLLAGCLCLGVVGLLPYLRLMTAASPPRLFSWGATASLPGLLTHFLRRDYGSFVMTSVGRMQDKRARLLQLGLRLRNYFIDLTFQQGLLGVVPVLAGVGWWVALIKPPSAAAADTSTTTRTRTAHWAMAVCWVCYLVMFHLLANIDLDRPLFHTVQARFWIQPNLLVFPYLGPGLHELVRLAGAPSSVEPVLVTALVAAQVARGWSSLDRSSETALSSLAHDTLAGLRQEAMLLVLGEENLYPLMYTQSCEGVRQDVRIVSKELSSLDWYIAQQAALLPGVVFPGKRAVFGTRNVNVGGPGSFSLGSFLRENVDRRPVYILGGARANHLGKQLRDPSVQSFGLVAWPEGLVEAVYNSTWHPSVDTLAERHLRAVAQLTSNPNAARSTDGEESWEWLALDAYWNSHYSMAWHMTQYGINGGFAHKWEVEDPHKNHQMGKRNLVDVKLAERKAFAHARYAYQTLMAEQLRQSQLSPELRVPYDHSFDGYIYKNSGFIAQRMGNWTEMQHFYRIFLKLHKSNSDPNIAMITSMLEDPRFKGQ